VEFDHADIYRDLDHVKEAFRKLVAGMPRDGTIVAATDHEGVRDVVEGAPCRVVGFGVGEGSTAEWRALAIESDATGTGFEMRHGDDVAARIRMPLFGRFNVENAMAGLVAVHGLGVPLDAAARALAELKGVKRRQEIRGEAAGVTVVDDFAHHPTAVRGSIESLRARFPGRPIVAVFEPRTNTSRRAIFQRDYARALSGADRIVVSVVPDAPIYSATGPVTETFSAAQLAADLCASGKQASAIDGVDAIVAHLARTCRPGDVVLVMSNGGFGGIWERLLEALRT